MQIWKIMGGIDPFDQMVQDNLLPYTYTSLLSGLCRKGKAVSALLFFDKVMAKGTVPNGVMLTCLVNGLFKAGQLKAALYIYDAIEKEGVFPDTVSLNAVIDGFSRMGKMMKAYDLLSTMRSRGLRPSLATYNILLHGFSKKKDLLMCSMLHSIMMKSGLLPGKLTCHSLILGFCETGMLECCKTGELGKASDLLNVMNKLGVLPDINTYDAIVAGLNRVSAFQESHSVVHDMSERGFTPKLTQCITLINGMCRMGNLQGAFRLRDEMEMEALQVSPCDVAESAIVRGLAVCGKVEEAMLVLNRMLRMRLVPTVATFTTLMYKFCKEANFVEALKLKGIMECCGVKLDAVAYNVLISGLSTW
ncbi:hypothetical protein Pint_03829 [Pistacia integerrima]|uniref:Uncharacterized protein n=1 Tax=Pistacia integerrima TaxID=434235 RepID=A0ACC0Z3A2_9ROSI|nr:hypothetical protein Pint_03829 [Pistacia integerrima]